MLERLAPLYLEYCDTVLPGRPKDWSPSPQYHHPRANDWNGEKVGSSRRDEYDFPHGRHLHRTAEAIRRAAMQFVVTWLSVRIGWVNNLVRCQPTLLLHDGEFLDRALLAEQLTRDDVKAARRSPGVGNASAASAVVLETDGSISVIMAQSAAP